VAILHTWLSTQTEGCGARRSTAQVPFSHTSTQQITNDANLNASLRRHRLSAGRPRPEGIVSGMPMWATRRPEEDGGNAELGSEDRPTTCARFGYTGVANLQTRAQGRAVLTVMDTADLAVPPASRPASPSPRARSRIVGSVVRSDRRCNQSDRAGYTDNLAIWCDNGPIFNVSSVFGGRGDAV
jgi:hypothetical protein